MPTKLVLKHWDMDTAPIWGYSVVFDTSRLGVDSLGPVGCRMGPITSCKCPFGLELGEFEGRIKACGSWSCSSSFS